MNARKILCNLGYHYPMVKDPEGDEMVLKCKSCGLRYTAEEYFADVDLASAFLW